MVFRRGLLGGVWLSGRPAQTATGQPQASCYLADIAH